MLRIVLPDATSRDDLDDTAASLGFLLVNIVPRTESYPAQVIYLTPDRQALVHLVDAGEQEPLSWVVRAEGGEGIEQRWASALRGEVLS
jgi:hypothetical protein